MNVKQRYRLTGELHEHTYWDHKGTLKIFPPQIQIRVGAYRQITLPPTTTVDVKS